MFLLLITQFANPIGPHSVGPPAVQSLFHCFPPLLLSRVAVLSWLGFGWRQMIELCSSSTLNPCDQQYPIGSNFLPDLEIIGFVDLGVDGPPPPVVGLFPCRRAISMCASESCFVMVAICVVSSEIVFDIRLTDSRSDFVVVAKFASAML